MSGVFCSASQLVPVSLFLGICNEEEEKKKNACCPSQRKEEFGKLHEASFAIYTLECKDRVLKITFVLIKVWLNTMLKFV